MISREPKLRPAIVSLDASATLHRRHHFHLARRRTTRSPIPIGAAPPSRPRPRCPSPAKPRRLQQRRDGRLLVDLDGFVVDGHLHRACSHRDVQFGRDPLGGPRREQESSAAVPRCDTSVRSSSRRRSGRLSGVIGRKPAAHSASSYSPSAGHHRARVVEQLAHAGHRGCGVAAVLVLGGADDHPVGARHQIHLAAVHAGADHALRHRHTAAPPAQPQHLALDRSDRQPGPQRGRVDAVGDDDGVGVACVVERSVTGGAHCTPSRSQCAASASTSARLSTASSVSATNPCRMPCARSGSTSRAADRQRHRAGPARPAIPRRSSGRRRRRGRRRPPRTRAP